MLMMSAISDDGVLEPFR